MSEEKDKPAFDEQTLAKLLEAAYVLQEYNRHQQELELRVEPRADLREPAPSPRESEDGKPAPQNDYTHTLGQIVETQHQIQVRHLELENAMALVAERVTEITKASGAAIGILEDKKIRYRAAAGLMTLPVGAEVPLEKALCAACLRTGHVMRCADLNPEFGIDAEECRRRGIQSLIAVPIYHEGGIAGGLEVYYSRTQVFDEKDVHTGQLMAGLVTEALARDEELIWKKSLATERAVMLEALEKLKPNLAALVGTSQGKDSALTTASPAAASSVPTFVCRKCGHELVGEEQFCGKCGSPRSSDDELPNLQSEVAHMVADMQEAMKASATPARDVSDRVHSERPVADSIEEEMAELFALPELRIDKSVASAELQEAVAIGPIGNSAKLKLEVALKSSPPDEDSAAAETALAEREHATAWTSAAAAKHFLEQLAGARPPSALVRFWNARRGDVYLAVAVILVAGVIRWGIWSNPSVGATGNPTRAAAGHHQAASDADLSLFDRMLISLGLAEPPPVPEYKGNPETQVWVDLHTALYYCPGTDLYGKTATGKYMLQREAQLNQFEPAYRKACD